MRSIRPPRWLHSRASFSSSVTSRIRNLRSQIWQPTGGIAAATAEGGYEKLIRAGFIRQSLPGIFHLLPLGLRVQEKIERLLDDSMRGLGASKVALSSVTSKELWERTGRFQQLGSELFKFEDRKSVPYLLSPTHEEEITSLVSRVSKSYKDLPLRLYQISRKYRDELRPRHGLLRTREFTMKDLYTFDVDQQSAISTYEEVQTAYSSFFERLGIPLLVAEASSGDMGGNKSHEYHMPSPLGEDVTVRCGECSYSANEEVAEFTRVPRPHELASPGPSFPLSSVNVWRGISSDRRTLVNAWYLPDGSASTAINVHAVRKLVPDIDASIEDVTSLWTDALGNKDGEPSAEPVRLVNLFDASLSGASERILQEHEMLLPSHHSHLHSSGVRLSNTTTSPHGDPLNLVRVRDGDQCPRCSSGALEVTKTLELGHTFYLGDRYSTPLKAMVTLPPTKSSQNAARTSPMQMGCFGIGITRIMGAVADDRATTDGLMWPASIAPYEVAVIPDKDLFEEASEVYDLLASMTRQGGSSTAIDVILDDRPESIAWKLKDADLTGYPIVVVIGRTWKQGHGCEVQCRSLSLRETVGLPDLPNFVATLLSKL